MEQTRDAALGDLTVLDLCDEKGQLMGKLLADMGATVIKVEPPEGDPARRIGPFVNDLPGHDRSLYFWQHNTSKLSITLSLEPPEGQTLFKRLVERSDIVLESFQPGYLDSLGLGYRHLSALYPRVIMTSLTGFGQTGPYRDLLTSDLVALAMGGPMASCGYDDVPGAPPIRGTGYQGYNTGCHWALIGMLMALCYRDLTGQGQYVDASIHEALACTTEAAMPYYLYLKQVPKRQTGRHHGVTPSPKNQCRAADGHLIIAWAVPRTPKHWRSLLDWLHQHGVGEHLDTEQYRTSFMKGGRGGPEIEHIFQCIREMVAKIPASEAYHEAQKLGYPWGLIRSPEETLGDPHLGDRGFFVEVEHPEHGKRYTYPGAPYIFSRTPWRIRRRAPLLGEDNEAVYKELLGYGRAELAVLREGGVI